MLPFFCNLLKQIKLYVCMYVRDFSLGLRIWYLETQDQRSFVGVLSHIINPLSPKLVRSRWLYIGRVLFLLFYGRRLRLGP